MVNDSKYNFTALVDLELVTMVVDCTFTGLSTGDPSTVRVFNVVRSRADTSDLYLVMMSLNVQNYEIPDHNRHGPASVTGTQSVRIHQELLHADILVVYLALVGLLSSIFRERIDPSVAIFLFEIIHAHRLPIVKSVPAILNEIITYSDAQYYQGVVAVSPTLAALSPFRFWTAYQLPSRDFTFLISSFFPKAILLSIIAGFTILRKIYRHYYPDPMRQRSSQSPERSMNDKTAVTLQGIVTHFEVSTGAVLQTRFGLISDYNNYVYFKGMKFASADGVYCSGYVVANGKFLVSSKDLPVIALMKLVGTRFVNVYVYEVDGNSVKDTARLVYPKTFMWSDLWRLNVMVLL
ncbi:hypothetical protein BBJ29_003443 [Phytophthora kernoviae]|uniref:Uncharacterized protein n=1 Tax=Phytophthora kernoviae TaxID=325452 RepID=A0A3F2RLG0_9STRA|nr:hypothetical protein BBP00_00006316 [Phytophthora kernoviae]RLN64888.1 hypothetical protein BBJ29_003443 [Phytophthora kernoviae]